jgi:hypothetical protein
MALALLQWVIDWNAMHSKGVTVLQESSSMPISAIFEGFFSTNCRNVSDVRVDLWTDNFRYQCAIHVMQISIFLTAAAYSLAPFARAHLLVASKFEHPGPADEEEVASNAESKIAERTEQQ